MKSDNASPLSNSDPTTHAPFAPLIRQDRPSLPKVFATTRRRL